MFNRIKKYFTNKNKTMNFNNQITVNGKTYTGNNITIKNGKVIIDGKEQITDDKVINIKIEGNLESISVDNCDSFFVKGDVNQIKAINANLEISGTVQGNVSTTNGNINCDEVGGSVSTTNGNIKHKL